MYLTEKDQKYLKRFKTNIKTIYINYIISVILIAVAAVNLVVGLKYGITYKFYSAILLGVIGIIFLVVTHVYKRLHGIIAKQEERIAELEKKT